MIYLFNESGSGLREYSGIKQLWNKIVMVNAFAYISLSVSRITKKLLTHFDEIFWRGGMCDQQQSFRFW